jgi:hypothetical protein
MTNQIISRADTQIRNSLSDIFIFFTLQLLCIIVMGLVIGRIKLKHISITIHNIMLLQFDKSYLYAYTDTNNNTSRVITANIAHFNGKCFIQQFGAILSDTSATVISCCCCIVIDISL